MRTALKATAIGLTGLVVIGGAALMWLWATQFSALKPVVESQLSDQLGRAVFINGDFSIAASLQPTLVAEDVSIANADWGSRPRMITAERIELQIEILPLLRDRDLLIQRLVLDRPDILLERQDNRTNWSFQTGGSQASQSSDNAAGADPGFSLMNVDIQNALIRYRAGSNAEATTLHVDRLQWESERPSDRRKLSAHGSFRDKEWTLMGSVGSIADFLSYGDSYPLDLSAQLGNIELTAQGSLRSAAADATSSDGLSVVLSAPSSEPLRELSGFDMPSVDNIRLSADIVYRPDGFEFPAISIEIGEMAARAEARVITDAPTPSISGSMSSQRIDFDVVIPPEVGEAAQASRDDQSTPISIPFPPDSLLSGYRAAFDVRIDELSYRDSTVAAVNAKIDVENGRLAISPLRFKIGGGAVEGTFVAQSGSPMVKADVEFKSVPAANLATMIGAAPTGSADQDISGSIRFTATGRDRGPDISGFLVLDNFDLGLFSSDDESEGEDLFSKAPLPTEWLKGYSADIGIEVARLQWNDFDLADLKLAVRIDDARLSIEPFAFDIAGGSTTGAFSLDAAASQTRAALSWDANRLDLNRLLAQFGAGDAAEGSASTEGNFESAGDSFQTLASALGGESNAIISNGRITDTRLNLLVTDLNILRILPFFGGRSDFVAVNCLVGAVKFDGGSGQTSILLDTPEMVLAGGGELNLGEEQMDMTFRPASKTGNLSTVEIPIRVHGSLTSPAVEVFELKRNAAKSIIGSLALPLNVLSQLIPKGSEDGRACSAAIDEARALKQK